MNAPRPRRRAPLLAPVAAILLLVPVIVSACITVESDESAAPGASAASITPGSPQASPTTPPLATPTPPPTPEPTLPPVEAEVVAFIPNWHLESAADSIDADLVTIAALHSIEASGDGRLVSKKPSGEVPSGWTALESDTFTELKERLQDAGVKVVPVVQRAGWSEGTRERIITLLSKKKTRLDLAERIARFVEQRGFDGVNLDFEPVPDRVADAYVAFVREVRAALDEVDPELHLSIDVVPSLENYDLAALTADDAADLAVIMGYGYRTSASAIAGSTAPLEDPVSGDLTETVAAAVAQAPSARLALGLPWYGYLWSTKSDKARAEVRSGDDIPSPTDQDYAEAVEKAATWGRRYQPGQASAWTAYAKSKCATCPSTWRQLWYDDPDSFGAKVDLALEQDLAGIGIWGVGMEGERDELWRALSSRLRPRVDENPPAGTPNLDPEQVAGDIDGRKVVIGVAPLWLFASDGPDGSGLALARISLDGAVDGEGMLRKGRTYPAVERIDFPLADEATGGSLAEGPRSIHVQWRDIAGNWSVPIVLDVHALEPAATETPSDL